MGLNKTLERILHQGYQTPILLSCLWGWGKSPLLPVPSITATVTQRLLSVVSAPALPMVYLCSLDAYR